MEYTIEIGAIEELQNLKYSTEIEKILVRAHSTIIQGGTVVLQRTNPDGSGYQFERISSEEELEEYRNNILKYL